MAAAYKAAPAQAPTPMPTLVPRTGWEEPESPPIGAPSPAAAEVVAAGFFSFTVVPSRLAPGWTGKLGLIIDIRVRIDAVGLP